jgi:quinol monooxygenase YgiN
MITIHVTMTFKPEFTYVAKILVNELKRKSKKEVGCISYKVREDVNDENTVILIEKFNDQESLNFHKETKHVQEILKTKLESMINQKVARFLK